MTSILIIDDNTHIRHSLKNVFEGLGYQIIEATNGKEALEILQAIKPSLVLVDILMPNMHGFETIRAIRNEAPDAKILAISEGFSIEDGDLLDVVEHLGATKVMKKPFELLGLLNTVNRVLASEETI